MLFALCSLNLESFTTLAFNTWTIPLLKIAPAGILFCLLLREPSPLLWGCYSISLSNIYKAIRVIADVLLCSGVNNKVPLIRTQYYCYNVQLCLFTFELPYEELLSLQLLST